MVDHKHSTWSPNVQGPEVKSGSGTVDIAPVSRQQERSDLSTRRLLQATATLIVERGYERMTMVDIGKRAGYSHGLVTQRFGNKANLLATLWERMSSRFGPERIFDLVGGRTGIDAIQSILLEIAQDAQRSPDDLRAFYALLFEATKPIPELQDHIRNATRAYRDMIADLMAAGTRAGTVRDDIDPELLTDVVLDSLRGATYHWMLDPQRADVTLRLQRLSDHFGRVYRTKT